MSLAFPVAMLVGHVYVLPFNSKPAALLYTTNQYSWSDTFKFGITIMFISWLMILLWGVKRYCGGMGLPMEYSFNTTKPIMPITEDKR